MFEIERKFRLQDGQHEEIRSSLAREFGEPQTHHQTDRIFVEPGKTLAKHRKGEPLIRLRDENGRKIFTYKRTILQTGNRIENETGVTHPEALEATLGELGWTLAVPYEKKRLEACGPDFTYALDTVVELLPTQYFEIEYVSERDDPDAELKIFAEARRLGINPEEQVEYRNYPMLILEVGRA